MRISDWSSDVCSSDLAGKEAWVAETMPLLNRARYVTETGARMNDAEVAEFLGEAWKTISTGAPTRSSPGSSAAPAPAPTAAATDRTSVVRGKSVAVRVDLGGRRII